MKLSNILAIGIIIRIAMAPFLAHPFDVYAWYSMCTNILVKGLFPANYFPPLMFYTLAPIAYLYQYLSQLTNVKPIPMATLPNELSLEASSGVTLVPDPIFNLLVKTPFLISDMIAAVLIYKIIHEITNERRTAERGAAMWMWNPLLIWISAAWGMFDTIPALLTLSALYLLVKNRLTASALSLSTAIAYKLYPLVLVIPTFMYLRKRRLSLHRQVKYVAVLGLSLMLLLLPSYYSPAEMFIAARGTATVEYAGATGEGLTYWISTIIIPVSPTSAIAASILIGLVLLALVTYAFSKRKIEEPLIDLASIQLAFIIVIYLSYRIISPQFIIWALPFLTLLTTCHKIDEISYRTTTFLAFLYSITSCLLPLYMLPLSPWIGKILAAIMTVVKPMRIRTGPPSVPSQFTLSFGSIFLTVLGVAFSIDMIIILIDSVLMPDRKPIFKFIKRTCRFISCRLMS